MAWSGSVSSLFVVAYVNKSKKLKSHPFLPSFVLPTALTYIRMTPLTIAAGFIVFFGLSLVILIIIIFSDFELTDAGDNLDLAARRYLGKSLLLHSFIIITLMLCFSSGVVSLRYLLGTLCSLVAFYLLVSGLRMILRASEKIEIDSSEAISREINQIEHAIRLRRQTTKISSSRSFISNCDRCPIPQKICG